MPQPPPFNRSFSFTNSQAANPTGTLPGSQVLELNNAKSTLDGVLTNLATGYSVSASVTQGSAFYRCLVAHTSFVSTTGLAAGKGVLIVDFSTIALVAAAMIAVTPSGSLTSNVQGSLKALDTGKAATSHTHVASAIWIAPQPAARCLLRPTPPRKMYLCVPKTLSRLSNDRIG